MKVQGDSSVLFTNISPQGSAVKDFGQASIALIVTLKIFNFFFNQISLLCCKDLSFQKAGLLCCLGEKKKKSRRGGRLISKGRWLFSRSLGRRARANFSSASLPASCNSCPCLPLKQGFRSLFPYLILRGRNVEFPNVSVFPAAVATRCGCDWS